MECGPDRGNRIDRRLRVGFSSVDGRKCELVMSHTRLLLWELVGFALIVALGIPLHWVFSWAGENLLIAWLAPVNESTWEHFKLCFWPSFLFAMFEYHLVEAETGTFWKA